MQLKQPYFFCSRIINVWNKLPFEVVCTLNSMSASWVSYGISKFEFQPISEDSD